MIYSFDNVTIDTDRLEVRVRGAPATLQPKALRLLVHLIRNRERAVSREELLRELWPGVRVTNDSLTQAVRMARRAIEDDSAEPRIIGTVRGHGYRWMA